MRALLLLLFFNYAAASSTTTETILQYLHTGLGMCDIVKKSFLTDPYPKFLQDLNCNITPSTTDIPFDPHNINSKRLYFCVGLLDAALRVCDMYNQLNTTQHQRVDEYFKNPPVKIMNDSLSLSSNMCDSYKDYVFETEFHWLEPGVSTLHKTLSTKNNCTKICLEGGKTNEVCALLFVSNKILHQFNYKSVPVTTPYKSYPIKENKPSEVVTQKHTVPVQNKELKITNDPKTVVNLPNQPKTANAIEDTKKSTLQENDYDKDFDNDEDSNRFNVPSEPTEGRDMESVETDATKNLKPQIQSSNKPTQKKETDVADKVKKDHVAISEKNEISENTANFEDRYDDYKGPEIGVLDEKQTSIGVPPIKKLPNEDDDAPVGFIPWYFLVFAAGLIIYIFCSNKKRILAYVLEGRRPNRGSRRRPSTAKYRKLDNNLEEAITSGCSTSTSHVIY